MSLCKSSWALPTAVAVLALAGATGAPVASAAVFLSTPPPTVGEGEGPLTWTFASDAPGTMWGAVTWRLSTESEWHMCGGASGSATLAAAPAGTYLVEIADEVDLSFSGASFGVAPFTRCSEAHAPALGPLHPVELSVVTVTSSIAADNSTATTTVSAVGCRVDRGSLRRVRAAVRTDLRRLEAAKTKARRGRWRRRLAGDEATIRALACR